MKVIKKNHLSGKQDLLRRLSREIQNLELLNHMNIVKYIDSFETSKEIYIAMEYVSGGELFDYVASKEGLSEEESRKIFRQIAQATSHIHKVNKADYCNLQHHLRFLHYRTIFHIAI